MTKTIYILKCPTSNEVRYVGATTQPVEKRLYQHITARRGATVEWVKELKLKNLVPVIEVVDVEVARVIAYPVEMEWVQAYKNIGCNLLNQICEASSGDKEWRMRYCKSLPEILESIHQKLKRA